MQISSEDQYQNIILVCLLEKEVIQRKSSSCENGKKKKSIPLNPNILTWYFQEYDATLRLRPSNTGRTYAQKPICYYFPTYLNVWHQIQKDSSIKQIISSK